VGLTADVGGWVRIEELLLALAAHGRNLEPADLARLVSTDEKGRFETTADGRIRAAQGHSYAVDLGLAASEPPQLLYHGTVGRFLGLIFAEGLRPSGRTHVHLSPDLATAVAVGRRRGEPVVLVVEAAALHARGQAFYRAANGVWLTASVPPTALTLVPDAGSENPA
jgi:putative RNA 2'-phosphotransferase